MFGCKDIKDNLPEIHNTMHNKSMSTNSYLSCTNSNTIQNKISGNISTISAAEHTLKLMKASTLYATESPTLIKKCMILAGFDKKCDLQESGQLYTFCLGRALEYDFERLDLLKSCNSKGIKIKNELNSRPLLQTTMASKVSSSKVLVTNSKFEMIKKALGRYRFESCYFMVKCMIEAGFKSSETDIYHPTYQLCLENALLSELNRWRYLRSNFRRARRSKIASPSLEAENKNDEKKSSLTIAA